MWSASALLYSLENKIRQIKRKLARASRHLSTSLPIYISQNMSQKFVVSLSFSPQKLPVFQTSFPAIAFNISNFIKVEMKESTFETGSFDKKLLAAFAVQQGMAD